MANSNISALYPEFWFAAFDKLDIGDYNLQNQISRSTESAVAKHGDTVNVPLMPSLTAADDWTPGDAITAENVTQSTAQVILNKSKKKTISLTATELSLSPYDLIANYGQAMAKQIAVTVNTDMYLELMKTPNFVDAISALDEDDIVDARTALQLNEVSSMNRKLIAGPDDMGQLLKLDAFTHANVSGNVEALEAGKLRNKFGFEISENTAISKYTPVDVAGAVDNGAGYVLGDTTMVVKDFNDDANPIREGDIFIVAGETGTPYHTVTATTTTTSDTTGITFTPALVSSVADSAVITVTPTRSILALVPDCAAFAARSYAELPAGVGVNSSVINWQGLPVRISVWHNQTLGVNVQFDILYGVKMINTDRIVRILSAV